MTDEECLVEFRFSKNEIHDLVGKFRLPEVINCYNGWIVDALEALCVVLKRYAYPSSYTDLVPRFWRSVPLLCTVANQITDVLFNQFNHLLRDIDQPWLSPCKGAALDNCWCFIDGTVTPICDQRVVYTTLQKYGNESTNRPNLELVLARSAQVSPVCTHHFFLMPLIYWSLCCALYLETFVAFSYEKCKEKGCY